MAQKKKTKDAWFEKIILGSCALAGTALAFRCIRLAGVGVALCCRYAGKKATPAKKTGQQHETAP